MNCQTCVFWDCDAVENYAPDLKGYCRVNPPVVIRLVADVGAFWPMTGAEDWCGMYQRQPQGAN